MKIVLAVDGSDQSYFAARALEHLAQMEKVIVVHALDVPLPSFPMIVPEVANELDRIAERKLREEGERILKFVGSILPPHTGPVTKRLEVGKPAEMILSVAEEVKADLVVLGARGLGLTQELLLGSVSHRVLTHAPCSVLIVNKTLTSLGRILLTLQGPFDAEAAVRFLSSKPFKAPGDVSVLSAEPYTQSIWPVGASAAESLRDELLKSARKFVDEVAARLALHGYRATGIVRKEAPATAILEHAKATRPDLILMGSRGLGGVSRFLLGSVSHTVLNRVPCPMLVFR
jgi:nucleotide-binding universal stress UspA family protein